MPDAKRTDFSLIGTPSEKADQLVAHIASTKAKLSWKQLIEIVPLNSSFLMSFVDSARNQIESDQIKGRFKNIKVYEYFGVLEKLASNETYSKEQEAEIYDLIDKISEVIISIKNQKESLKEKKTETDDAFFKKYGLSKKDFDEIDKQVNKGDKIGYAILIILGVAFAFWSDSLFYAIGIVLGLILIIQLL